MRRTVLLALALLPALAAVPLAPPPIRAQAGPTGQIRVTVRGLRHGRGQVGCNLYDAPPGFPSDARAAREAIWVPIRNRSARCLFLRVPAGTYAIGVLHDEDGNSLMNANVFGAPQEGWGVSNDAPPGLFSPPAFQAASFRFDGTQRSVPIRMHY